MKVLKEKGNPVIEKLNDFEDYLRLQGITITLGFGGAVEVDGVVYAVRDTSGGSGGAELPRTTTDDRYVLWDSL